jgi:NAD-dependent deacetylase
MIFCQEYWKVLIKAGLIMGNVDNSEGKDVDLIGPHRKQIEKVKQALNQAKRVAVLTGAGVSAESGVPTFRGADGLWRQYRATDLATPEAFARDPKLVWEFYNWRRELLAPLKPNPGHHALTQLENQVPEFFLITQNIDGLHQAAGSREMLEIHGSIWRVRCTRCARVAENRTVPLPTLPACEACGGLLRPDVVWFGEALDTLILVKAYKALSSCQVLLIVGTSGNVEPAASMGLHAKTYGAKVVEVNLEPTPQSASYDITLSGKSGFILPLLIG